MIFRIKFECATCCRYSLSENNNNNNDLITISLHFETLSYNIKLTDTISKYDEMYNCHGIYEHSTSTTITPDLVHTRCIILRYASKHTEESSNHRKLPPSLSYSRHNGTETGSLEWQNFIGTETSVAKGATIDRHNHSFLFYRNTSFYTSIWKVLF